MKNLINVLLFVGLIFGCRDKSVETTSTTTIEIMVNNHSQIMIDDQLMDIDSFQKVASHQLANLAKQGVDVNSIVVLLKADKSVDRGFVNDLEIELRELELRRIKYSEGE